MERLTRKALNGYDGYYQECCNKLGQLEDIEEELGIELVALFRALEKGVYVVDYKGQEPYKTSGLELDLKNRVLNYHWSFLDMNGYDSGTTKYYFKDYGKTWALTKEELTSKEKEMIERGLLTDKPQF